MSEVLYRKYRARSFDQLIGQDHVKKVLLEQIKRNELSHAYLFTGPRGTGKTSVARLLAREVNGYKAEDVNNFQLDIIEIDAASNRGIEEIRQLKESVNFAPSSAKYKVYIIDEVHMLTKEAFNALLKTLEEPPSHVIFIMATTEPEKVPITILSRVMRFDFKLASYDDLKKKLMFILESENKKVSDDALELVAQLGRGSFRDSESILEKVLSSLDKAEIEKSEVEEVLGLASSELIDLFIKHLFDKDRISALNIIKQVENSGLNTKYFINQILENLRRKMIEKTVSGKGDFNLKDLVGIINAMIEANEKMRYSPIETLVLELAVIEITNEQTTTTEIKEVRTIKKEVKVTKPIKQIIEIKPQVLEKVEEVQEIPVQVEALVEEIIDNDVNIEHDLKVDDIISKWTDVINAVKSYNGHLVAFLSKSRPISIEANTLVIGVGYEFHKQRIEQKRSKDALSKVFNDIFGVPFGIKCNLDGSLKNENFDDNLAVNSNEDLVEEIFN